MENRMINYDLLLKINGKSREIIENLKTFEKIDDLNRCIAFANDFSTWLSYCSSFSEYRLIREAQTECINSICLCAQGFYKAAISTLRQCLEHTLFSVMLSTNDYNYRLWQAGKCDMSWTQLMDDQNGIFGTQFIRTYADDVDEARSTDLLKEAKKVYRECSEFVHGNFEKLNILTDSLTYNEEAFNQYIKHFGSIQYIICMALFIRFREILNNPDTLRQLESVLIDNIGMLPEVQMLYNKGEVVDE